VPQSPLGRIVVKTGVNAGEKAAPAEVAVEIASVSKTFRKHTLTRRSYSTVKTSILSRLFKRQGGEGSTLTALQHFSMKIPKGSSFGVIGRNGSGKSTLLKLIAGIYQPDTGTVSVQGRVAALIELGAGFHPDFTGRENIYLGGIMYGMSRKEVDAKLDDIVAFAELEEFIDDPVRTYSSGMYMRLGFSLAVHTDPEVLLIDEVLAVGDAGFIHRCQERISEFKRRGKTMIFVTHDLDSVARWCDHAVWLDKGVVRAEGEPVRVIDTYLSAINDSEREELKSENEAVAEESVVVADEPTEQEEVNRWGSRQVEITSVKMLSDDSREEWVFRTEDRVKVVISYVMHEPVDELVFGIGLLRADGTVVFGTNTAIAGVEPPLPGSTSSEQPLHGECTFFVDRLGLTENTYFLDVAAHREDGLAYDYHHLMHRFSVRGSKRHHGVYEPKHRWSFSVGHDGASSHPKQGTEESLRAAHETNRC
jgi:ABC-type polysaccharide/polyol phosphate transport system ATPase subunit